MAVAAKPEVEIWRTTKKSTFWPSFPIHSFGQFFARMYRFATIQNVTDDRQTTQCTKGLTDSTVGQKPGTKIISNLQCTIWTAVNMGYLKWSFMVRLTRQVYGECLIGNWGKVQIYTWHSWCHCHSLSQSSKSRLVLPSWTKSKRAVKQLCLCVRACVMLCMKQSQIHTADCQA